MKHLKIGWESDKQTKQSLQKEDNKFQNTGDKKLVKRIYNIWNS